MPFKKCPECQETNYAEELVLCPNIRLRFQRTTRNTSAQVPLIFSPLRGATLCRKRCPAVPSSSKPLSASLDAVKG